MEEEKYGLATVLHQRFVKIDNIVFDSDFDSGNLEAVSKVGFN